MLRAYTYQVENGEIPGLEKCNMPQGLLRLENTIKIEKPEEADIFIFPVCLFLYREPEKIEQIRKLKYMQGREERHVFFDVSDYDQTYSLKSIFIRCNAKKYMFAADPNTISWAWPVPDLGEIREIPKGGFRYDISFHGWINYRPREDAARSCLINPYLRCDMMMHKEFHGYVERDTPDLARVREKAYKESLRYSRISLCGRSIPQVFPYRFFEALSAARVPALFCTDYTLPWQNKIDWEKCALLFKEDQADQAGGLIDLFLKKTPDEKLIEMGKYGRQVWEEYLDKALWPKTMTMAVEEKLKSLGLSHES